MSLVHLHLLLNHVPVFATVSGVVLLACALPLKSDPLKKTGLVFFALAALIAVPVYFTGEPAEHAVEGLAGVSKPFIEQHEDIAKLALITLLALGAISLGVLAATRTTKSVPNAMTAVVAVAAIIVAILMGITANLGGQVRHSEIRLARSPTSDELVVTQPRERHEDQD